MAFDIREMRKNDRSSYVLTEEDKKILEGKVISNIILEKFKLVFEFTDDTFISCTIPKAEVYFKSEHTGETVTANASNLDTFKKILQLKGKTISEVTQVPNKFIKSIVTSDGSEIIFMMCECITFGNVHKDAKYWKDPDIPKDVLAIDQLRLSLNIRSKDIQVGTVVAILVEIYKLTDNSTYKVLLDNLRENPDKETATKTAIYASDILIVSKNHDLLLKDFQHVICNKYGEAEVYNQSILGGVLDTVVHSDYRLLGPTGVGAPHTGYVTRLLPDYDAPLWEISTTITDKQRKFFEDNRRYLNNDKDIVFGCYTKELHKFLDNCSDLYNQDDKLLNLHGIVDVIDYVQLNTYSKNSYLCLSSKGDVFKLHKTFSAATSEEYIKYQKLVDQVVGDKVLASLQSL